MTILVVNDDGITSPGIERLARMAKKFGEVYVVAPASQCSAMSQRINVFGEITVKKESFPVEAVHAYSVDGTPADCVKIGLQFILPNKPDYVFSGINHGYNAGYDIMYSGTVGAALEALSEGVKAFAFSCEMNDDYTIADEFMYDITKDLMELPIASNALWNINFPGCSLEEYKGVLRNTKIAATQLYQDHYVKEELPDGNYILKPQGIPVTTGEEGTDIHAVMNGYISIGIVESAIIEK